jgi:hypothetical protein
MTDLPYPQLGQQNGPDAPANGLALYTRNPDDFAGLGDLVDIVGV